MQWAITILLEGGLGNNKTISCTQDRIIALADHGLTLAPKINPLTLYPQMEHNVITL